MNVRDFLTVAEALLNESTEATWRSAVSRAAVLEAIKTYERDILKEETWQR